MHVHVMYINRTGLINQVTIPSHNASNTDESMAQVVLPGNIAVAGAKGVTVDTTEPSAPLLKRLVHYDLRGYVVAAGDGLGGSALDA